MKTIFKNVQTNSIFLECSKKIMRQQGKRSLSNASNLLFLVTIPSIHMLADYNAIDMHVPHMRGAVSAGFKIVINLLVLVGTIVWRL
jgi:uncharacterized membrane protein (DUF485 family)